MNNILTVCFLFLTGTLKLNGSDFFMNELFFLFQIHSDHDDRTGNIIYSLEGVGANQYPFNVFVVNSKTGLITLNQKLDREEISSYDVSNK